MKQILKILKHKIPIRYKTCFDCYETLTSSCDKCKLCGSNNLSETNMNIPLLLFYIGFLLFLIIFVKLPLFYYFNII